jgi:S1-C subfamily serine protease
LIEGQVFEYAWLGISGNTLTAEAVIFRDLASGTKGALIMAVAEDGPADEAGLDGRNRDSGVESDEFRFGGDIITAIDGQPITDMDDLISYLVGETRPGETVTLDVIRADGAEEQVEVTLGVRPAVNTPDPDDE